MERFSNASQKYKNLIIESSLIHHGSPSVHLLASKTQKIKTFLKKTIGTEKLSRQNKNILLLGETGSGKSTIINALFNFAIGIEWMDDFWCEIVEILEPQSQTSDVTMYNIHEGTLDFSLTIVDTPGLGDTRGSDGLLTNRLLDLFQSEDGVSEIHAVGLVLKASENRLSDRLTYILNSITSLFDKDMEQKIVALFTHSDGRKPTNALQALKAANIKCSRDDNNEPVYFLFDNCQRDDRTEGAKYLELANDSTMKNIENFMRFIRQQEPKHLRETVEVLKERISLRQSIKKLKNQVQQVTEKEKEVYWSQTTLTDCEKMFALTQNFNIEEAEEPEEPVDKIGYIFYSGATCCKTCKYNCHFPGCTWARSPSWCAVMKNGSCTVCPGKCPAGDHVKIDKKYPAHNEKITKMNKEVKEKYEENEAEREKKKRDLFILQKELTDLKQIKDKGLNEAFKIIEKLEKITLNVDSMSTHVHLDFMIENMKENGDAEKVLKLETMKARMDERNWGWGHEPDNI